LLPTDAGNEPAELLWPLKERHPRHDTEPNWYFTQEDLLQELQAARSDTSWRWTVWRPPTVLGFVPGAPLSMVAAVGVCTCSLAWRPLKARVASSSGASQKLRRADAAVMRELGRPLCYPGGPPVAKQLCDSRLQARGFAWAAEAESAQDQIL